MPGAQSGAPSNAISRMAEFGCLSYPADAAGRGDSRHPERAVVEKTRRAYLLVRGLTQAGMLAMAAVSVSPILMRLLSVSPEAAGASVWLGALAPLCALTVTGYIATNVLRYRWRADHEPSAR